MYAAFQANFWAVAAVFFGLLATGCWSELEAEGDYDPPRVIEILPASPVIAVDGSLEVRFSEALFAENVNADSVVIVERSLVNETFISDLDNPPLIDSRKDDVNTTRPYSTVCSFPK